MGDGDWTLLAKYGNRYEFDVNGLLTQHVDRNKNVTEYEYLDEDTDGVADELDRITVQGGLEWNYAYAGAYLDYVEDFALRKNDFTIDGGTVTSVAQPGNVTLGFVHSGPADTLSSTGSTNMMKAMSIGRRGRDAA